MYYECSICPHVCKINRKEDLGFCQAGEKALVASYGPHYGEEDILVGSRGSGTIFFGFCNMRCVYCQNRSLSFAGDGDPVSNEELADIMLYMQNHHKCHNINLVTPSHFTLNIIEAFKMAKGQGLTLPIVYNCGGYESVETLKLLEGIVDIYMPDFKYASNEKGKYYSGVEGYFDVVKLALKEMDRQVGGAKTRLEDGLLTKGLLIRHLVLPEETRATKEILDFIKSDLSEEVFVNLMNQYYPANLAYKFPNLKRRLSHIEHIEVTEYAEKLGLRLI